MCCSSCSLLSDAAHCSQPPPCYQSKGYGGAAPAARWLQLPCCSSCSPLSPAGGSIFLVVCGSLCVADARALGFPTSCEPLCSAVLWQLQPTSSRCFYAAAHCSQPPPHYQSTGYGEAAPAAHWLPSRYCSSRSTLPVAAFVLQLTAANPQPITNPRAVAVLSQLQPTSYYCFCAAAHCSQPPPRYQSSSQPPPRYQSKGSCRAVAVAARFLCCFCAAAHCSQPMPHYKSRGHGGAAPAAHWLPLRYYSSCSTLHAAALCCSSLQPTPAPLPIRGYGVSTLAARWLQLLRAAAHFL